MKRIIIHKDFQKASKSIIETDWCNDRNKNSCREIMENDSKVRKWPRNRGRFEATRSMRDKRRDKRVAFRSMAGEKIRLTWNNLCNECLSRGLICEIYFLSVIQLETKIFRKNNVIKKKRINLKIREANKIYWLYTKAHLTTQKNENVLKREVNYFKIQFKFSRISFSSSLLCKSHFINKT